MNTLQSFWEPIKEKLEAAGQDEKNIFYGQQLFFSGAAAAINIADAIVDMSEDAAVAVWCSVHEEALAFNRIVKARGGQPVPRPCGQDARAPRGGGDDQ